MRTAKRSSQKRKRIEEVLSYAVGHRIRIEVLALLNEGIRCPEELAELIGEPTNKVSFHIKELAEAGSIELADTEQARNATRHYYRAVEMPFYSDEEIAAMPPQQRQVIYGLILQSVMAESLAAFWAGKIQDDPRAWLSWRWFNVDDRGRNDIADEQAASWERCRDIEGESINRMAMSGEKPTSIIVASLGFERHRTTLRPPPLPEKPD